MIFVDHIKFIRYTHPMVVTTWGVCGPEGRVIFFRTDQIDEDAVYKNVGNGGVWESYFSNGQAPVASRANPNQLVWPTELSPELVKQGIGRLTTWESRIDKTIKALEYLYDKAREETQTGM